VMWEGAFIARNKSQVAIPAEETSTVTREWLTCHWRRKTDEWRKEIVSQK